MTIATAPVADDVIQYPDTPFPLESSLILLGRRGSEAHGTYIPSGSHDGIDDRDLMGIVIPPASYYLGMKRWDNAEAIKGPWDVVLYELRKFVGLLCQQNPNVLQLLWLEDEDYLPVRSKANRLLGLNLVRERLTFRQEARARDSFAGYAKGQMDRMTHFNREAMQKIADIEARLTELGVDLAGAAEGKWDRQRSIEINTLCEAYQGMRRQYHKAYMGAKRWALVQKHGYDCKNAAHLIRLLHLGYEYLTTGRLNVRRTWDVEMLLEIKRGEWELARVQEHADSWFLKVNHVPSVLPEGIDMDKVDTIVKDMVWEHMHA